jgi:hypothetical protein
MRTYAGMWAILSPNNAASEMSWPLRSWLVKMVASGVRYRLARYATVRWPSDPHASHVGANANKCARSTIESFITVVRRVSSRKGSRFCRRF